MEELIIETIEPRLFPIVARQTHMSESYKTKITEMAERGELVMFAVRRDTGISEDNYMARVCLWMAPAEEADVRDVAKGAAFVSGLQVNERARLQGIADDLMNHLETEAKNRGYKQIAVGVDVRNEPGLELVKSLGYRYQKLAQSDTYKMAWYEVEESGSRDHTMVDAVLMVKNI